MSASPVIVPFMATSEDKVASRLTPLSHSALAEAGLDAKECTYSTVDTELYELVCAYVVKNASVQSFKLNVGTASEKSKQQGRLAVPTLGLGVHSFEWDGNRLFALHEECGQPVGSDCGAVFFKHLVLLAPVRDGLLTLQVFCNSLLAAADETEARSFTIYRWDVRHSYWMKEQNVRAR